MIFISTTSLENHSDAVETVKRLAEAGFRDIEIGADHKYPTDTDRIMSMKKEFGLRYTVHVIFPPTKDRFMVNIASADDKVLKESIGAVKSSIDFCNRAEAELYSIHSGFLSDIDIKGRPISKSITIDRCKEIMKESMAEIADYADEYGINVAIENHCIKVNYFTRPSLVLNLIKETKLKNIGLLVDVGHLNVASKKYGFDKKKEIDAVKDRILELHVSQNNGEWDEHRPLADGGMLDCIPKDILKSRFVTIEGFNWKIEDVKKSADIIKNLISG
jgi:sugar phosphate isomerase/epimerase